MPERRRRACQPQAPAAANCDVVGAVLRAMTTPVELVVQLGDRLPQLANAGHGGVLVVIEVDGYLVNARRGPRQLAGLGLALAEVAPIWVARVKAEPRCL